jgi:uncharacterized membrane protein YfcA
MHLGLWQWVLAALAAYMSGLAKTGVAGLSVLGVAIFASVLPARESVGVALIVLIAGDFVAVTVYRRDADWGHLVRLFPWALVGIGLGTLTLGRVDDHTLRRLLGAILMALVLIQMARGRKAVEAAVEKPRWWFVLLTGVAAGFTTMIANAAAPVMVLYLLAMRLPKITFIGTTAWFFLAINLIKVPFSYHLGLINVSSVWMSARLWPFAIAGALSGRWLIVRINQRLFEALALGLTLLASLRMLLA